VNARGVEPGDLVLVKSPGVVFAAGRLATGNLYDHVGVVVRRGLTVNIDKPGARTLPVDRLLRSALRPRLLRPRWGGPAEREGFVDWIEGLVSAPYDTRRTLQLLPRVLLRRWAGIARPLERADEHTRRWICTDAVLVGLERYAAGFAEIRALPLDWVALRCGTTNDFLVIARERSDLICEVPVPD